MRRTPEVVVAAVAALVIFAVPAEADPADAVASDEETAAASSYADAHDVSVAQARSITNDQVVLMEAVSRAGLVPGEDIDVWFEPTDEGQRFVIRSSKEGVIQTIESARVSRYTEVARDSDSVLIGAAKSEVDSADLAQLKDRVPNLQGHYVRESDGALVLDVSGEQGSVDTDSLADSLGFQEVVAVYGGEFSDAIDIRGGTAMGSCTAGFTASYGDNDGILTAAHCFKDSSSMLLYGGTAESGSSTLVTEQRYRWDETADIAFAHAPAGNNMTSTRFASSSSSTVDTGTPVSVGAGQTVCRRGKTSGWQCGDITDISYAPDWDDACPDTSCSPAFVQVDAYQEGGDSGGPWSAGSHPAGLHKGGNSTTSVFSKISNMPSGVDFY